MKTWVKMLVGVGALWAVFAAMSLKQGVTMADVSPAPPEEGDVDMATATFGAGCYWGVEARFRAQPGVTDTAVGFMGGHVVDPSYRDVCAGGTGHTEVVHLRYDPDAVSYETLLEVFFDCHDPTLLNRQGPDVGYQYRSVIFYHTPEQKALAQAVKERLDQSGKYRQPIATAIEEAVPFYKAEEYHQQYLEKRGGNIFKSGT